MRVCIRRVSADTVDKTVGIGETDPQAEKIEPQILVMPKISAQPDARFLRAGNPPTVWVVERIMEMPDMPPHVRLFREDRPTQTLFIGISVLDDIRQFRLLPEPPNQD